jgi:hypothetical protein
LKMIGEIIKYKGLVEKILKIALVMCWLIIPAGVRSQYVEIRAKLDTDQVTIGDQFNLNLLVSYPAGIEVGFPEIGDSLAGKIEVLRQSNIDTLVANDRLELKRKILLTCFDSGIYEITPLPFTLTSADWKDSLYSNPVFLAVNTVPLDSVIRDIKQPINVPVSFAEIYPFILIAIGIAVLTYFVLYLLRKRKRKEPVFIRAKPGEPAHIIALRELDELMEAKLWQRNEYKQYYTRLTEIIRNYIERRFNIPAMEQTSDDILQSWKKTGYDDRNLYDILKQLLNLADLVKFAKEKPVPSDNEVNLDNAYVFVRNTKPVSIDQEKTESQVQIPEETTVNG